MAKCLNILAKLIFADDYDVLIRIIDINICQLGLKLHIINPLEGILEYKSSNMKIISSLEKSTFFLMNVYL